MLQLELEMCEPEPEGCGSTQFRFRSQTLGVAQSSAVAQCSGQALSLQSSKPQLCVSPAALYRSVFEQCRPVTQMRWSRQ